MRSLLLLGCAAFFLSVAAKAASIEADFVRAELPPNSTTITTPIFLGPPGDISDDGLNNSSVGEIVFLRFSVPDIADVFSIATFDFFVTVYDDDDGGGESADFAVAQPGTNVIFPDVFTTLNHIEANNPEVIEIELTQTAINQIFPSLLDGSFRIPDIARHRGLLRCSNRNCDSRWGLRAGAVFRVDHDGRTLRNRGPSVHPKTVVSAGLTVRSVALAG